MCILANQGTRPLRMSVLVASCHEEHACCDCVENPQLPTETFTTHANTDNSDNTILFYLRSGSYIRMFLVKVFFKWLRLCEILLTDIEIAKTISMPT